MDKAAKELIEKMAVTSDWVAKKLGPSSPGGGLAATKAKGGFSAENRIAGGLANAEGRADRVDGRHFQRGTPTKFNLPTQRVRKDAAGTARDMYRTELESRKKESTMKNIIDDIIKGAEQNTFGRPVRIETNLDKAASELIQKMAAPSALSDQKHIFVGLQRMAGVPRKYTDGKLSLNPTKDKDAIAAKGKFNQWARGAAREAAPEKKEGSWTPLDIAKTAGALVALEEQGYSVKQAAEYLGLTEAQVQDIVATVR
jgi:hypothetical protein